MKLNIETIEYVEDGKWYLTIGLRSPWDNLYVRIPRVLAVFINKIKIKIKG